MPTSVGRIACGCAPRPAPLDELVLRPLRPLLGAARHLLLAPDGALNLIPFGALVDETQHYLLERVTVSYLTSGRDLLRPPSPRPELPATPGGGEPGLRHARGGTGGAGHSSAPAPPARRSAVRRPSTSRPYRARPPRSPRCSACCPAVSFGPGALRRRRPSSRCRVPACCTWPPMASFSPTNPRRPTVCVGSHWSAPVPPAGPPLENPLLRAGLALAGAMRPRQGQEDGLLTALEVAGLDLWGTELVVLSACDTGVGRCATAKGCMGCAGPWSWRGRTVR